MRKIINNTIIVLIISVIAIFGMDSVFNKIGRRSCNYRK